MYIKRVYVENYRSFNPSGDFLDLNDDLNIIVGRNDTGKSNFIDALDIILGNRSPYQIYLDSKDFYDPTKSINIEVDLVDMSDEEIYKAPYLSAKQKQLIIIEKPERELSFTYHHPPFNKPDEDQESEEEKISCAFCKRKRSGQLDERILRNAFNIRKTWVQQMVVPISRNASDDLNASRVYKPFSILLKEFISESPKRANLEQDLISANKTLNEIFLEVQKDLFKSTSQVTTFDNISLALTKENKPEGLVNDISIFLKSRDRVFEIDQVGTGTQSAIIIAMLEFFLKRKTKKVNGMHKIFTIEEPEIFLHPHAIRRVANLLQQVGKQADFQVIACTHSPDFSLVGLPFNIFRFDLVDNSTKIKKFIDRNRVLDLEIKAKREITRSNSEMLFAKKVILVEGEAEQSLLSVLSKSYVPKGGAVGDLDLDKFDVSVVYMGGKDNYAFYYRYLNELGIKCYFLFDGDITEPILDNLIKLYNVKPDKNTREGKIKELDRCGVHVLQVNEIEDFYPIKLLAEIRGCPEGDLSKEIDNSISCNRGELRNAAIKNLIKNNGEEIIGLNMDVEELQIDKWWQEELGKINKTGSKGEKIKGKAVSRIFNDIGKVRLGILIANLMVRDGIYPAEIMNFVANVCNDVI